MSLLSRLPVVPLRLISYHLASAYFPSPASSSRRHASTSTSQTDRRKAYSHTLLLPKASMPLKQKRPAEAEAALRSRNADELYRKQIKDNPGDDFVLHDGPPYANGNLHMGHALNKTLKDIINRYRTIRGYRVHYVPGWDCHGLPIEMKALQDVGKSHRTMDAISVRQTARKTALDAIEVQKREMRDLGVMADWDGEGGTYRTMDHDYEIRQLRLFKTMVSKGYITHRLRPTYYSPSSRTALAEAELSYKDGHKSRSVYVGFPVAEEDMSDGLRKAYDDACGNGERKTLKLAIWTTTAWSLAGNSGVMVDQARDYVIAQSQDEDWLVLLEERVEAMQNVLGDLRVLSRFPGTALIGTRYSHLFHPKSSDVPRSHVFHSRFVTATSGTGLVHSAPAHGHEDYQSFVETGILPDELRCPVDDDGNFTGELVEWAGDDKVRSLVGKSVLGDGVTEMIRLLREEGSLLAEETVEHRYPYDWKSKKPIIVRATAQWFADVEAIKPTAAKALEAVAFYPATSQKRLEAHVLSRSEWCISRQRSWGVPIPALYDTAGEPLLNTDTIDHIISVLDAKGIDHWWSGPSTDFIPPSHQGQDLTKGTDTLDVWFDSGSSWTLLDPSLKEASKPLADVYLEGSDQHRGWFQSSLLTRLSTAAEGHAVAPYAAVITHGFITDEKGQKMSKSLGNGFSPMDVIHGKDGKPGPGADALRLWAAGVEYQRDVSIGPAAIGQASEALRKMRSVLRFMLGNVQSMASGMKTLEDVKGDLTLVDRYVLHELSTLEEMAQGGYETYLFNRVLNATNAFVSSTLSAFYFDVIKDTLYCHAENDPSRVAILAVLHHVLRSVAKIIAPIVPHLSEEVYQHLTNGAGKSSIFLDHWTTNESWIDEQVKNTMDSVMEVRSGALGLMEAAREQKNLKTGTEAALYIEGSMTTALGQHVDLLPRILGVSSVQLRSPQGEARWTYTAELETDQAVGEATTLTLRPALGEQCVRCWLFTAEPDRDLCDRCHGVVG